MLFLTTIEIIVVLGPDLKFSESVMQQIYQQFMVTDSLAYSPPTNNPHVELYDFDQLYSFINRTVTNYYNL